MKKQPVVVKLEVGEVLGPHLVNAYQTHAPIERLVTSRHVERRADGQYVARRSFQIAIPGDAA
jgi:hypothetical protein